MRRFEEGQYVILTNHKDAPNSSHIAWRKRCDEHVGSVGTVLSTDHWHDAYFVRFGTDTMWLAGGWLIPLSSDNLQRDDDFTAEEIASYKTKLTELFNK